MYFSDFNSGWGYFTLQGIRIPFSYIRNTPLELLQAFICYYKCDTLPAVTLDAEGSEDILVFDEFELFVIRPYSFANLIRFDLNREEFIKAVLQEMKDGFDDWVDMIFGDLSDLEDREHLLKSKITELEQAIEEYEKEMEYSKIQ